VVDPHRIQQAIADTKDQASFIQRLLIDTLEWSLDERAMCVDDISYEWTADELRADDLDRHVVDNHIFQIQPPKETEMPWGVFIVEFRSPDAFTTGRGMTGPLRRILRGLVPKARGRPSHLPAWDRQNLLFICTHNYEHFRFAYFKAPPEGTKTAPLATFGWSPGVPARTVCEFNLGRLEWPERGIAEGDWVTRWASAFDVEKVTKEFYKDYDCVFHEVEALIHDQGDHDLDTAEDLRMFTQSLFNRLMFLRFVERKGWLIYQGDTDYLRALHAAGGIGGRSLCQSRIHPLFFEGLAVEGIDKQEVFGNTVFLNGGLFEKGDLDAKVRDVPDEVFDRIIGTDGLFYHYNFTVEESTPLDIEVAVDPEMLGKVFEELVTGRHETGSYYTPRQVVSFMCREALKGYLGEKTDAAPDTVASLVDRHEVEALSVTHARQVLRALDGLKAVDPACGSGAYLLGLLHEMAAIYRLLYSEKLTRDARSLFRLKQQIICNNLYGVDLDPFATSIAMLRLWLSLIVEFDEFQPPPLPNLDFKIETGDSLLGPCEPIAPTLEVAALHTLAEKLVEKKDSYLTAHGDQKRQLKAEIDRYTDAILDAVHHAHRKHIIDWRVHFAEVFVKKGGFDIVLANPPYVRQELITDLKPALQRLYPEIYGGRADLYCYVYYRALQLLGVGGFLVFISSNKWYRAAYGTKLRKHIGAKCEIQSITDFGELPVFAASATFPTILVAQKKEPHDGPVFTRVESLDPPYPDIKALLELHGEPLPLHTVSGAEWRLTDASTARFLRRVEAHGKRLRDYTRGAMYSGIKSGCNDAFLIDESTRAELLAEDPKSDEIIKHFARGDNVRRWRICDSREYIIYTPPGTEIEDYPAIRAHLMRFRSRLEARAVQQPYWQLQQAQNRPGTWESPKIAFPDIAKEPRFTLDEENYFLDMTAFILPGRDLFLLGVLNSSVAWRYIAEIAAVIGDARQGGRLRLKRQYVERVPVPEASNHEKAAIARLVRQCLNARGEGCAEWEREIDERVARLYEIDWKEGNDAIRMPPPADAAKPAAGKAAGRKGKPPKFELHSDTRTVTGRLDLKTEKPRTRRRSAKKTPAGKSKSASVSINDFDRDQLKDTLLEVVGTDWTERDDAIRDAARHLGFRRTGKRIQDAFKSAITGLLRQKKLESAGSQIRRA